jgi:hypothetical protein
MMIGRGIDIAAELEREKAKDAQNQKALLDTIKSSLSQEAEMEASIRQNIKGGNFNLTNIQIDQLSSEKIYTEKQIENICVKYRLRFLESSLFQGEIPYEAITKIKALQKQEGTEFNAFKIVAPSALFQLKDKNDKDPLLFLNLGNGLYYLIHQWGNDMAWHRKILSWPKQNLLNLFFTIAASIGIFIFALPDSVFMTVPEMANTLPNRMFLYFYLLIATCGLTVFFGLAFNKNFSNEEWDSKFFN